MNIQLHLEGERPHQKIIIILSKLLKLILMLLMNTPSMPAVMIYDWSSWKTASRTILFLIGMSFISLICSLKMSILKSVLKAK